MKNKIVVITKHLHSSCSTMCSTDEWVYIRTNSSKVDFDLHEGVVISSKWMPLLNGEIVKRFSENVEIIHVEVESDRKFYNNSSYRPAFSTATEKEMKELLKTYLDRGWVANEPIESTLCYNNDRAAELMHRRQTGFVIYDIGKDPKKMKAEDYAGGLSKQLLMEPYLKRYLSERIPFGYVGGYNRKFIHDHEVEYILRKQGLDSAEIAVLLCSKPGRQMMDSLDGSNEADIDYIRKHIHEYFLSERDQVWFIEEVEAARFLKKQNRKAIV
jgi:hypothetical protein